MVCFNGKRTQRSQSHQVNESSKSSVFLSQISIFPLSLPSCLENHFWVFLLLHRAGLSLKVLLTNWNCSSVAENKIHMQLGWVYHGNWLISSYRALKIEFHFINIDMQFFGKYCYDLTHLLHSGEDVEVVEKWKVCVFTRSGIKYKGSFK